METIKGTCSKNGNGMLPQRETLQASNSDRQFAQPTTKLWIKRMPPINSLYFIL